MTSTRKRLTVALAAVGLAATACGDDDSTTISKAQYVAQSNAICTSTQKASGEAFVRIVGKGHPTPRQAQRFLTESVVPQMRRNVAERAQIPVPAGDAEQVRAILAAGRRAIAAFEQIATDRAQTAALFRGASPDPAREFDALSKRYGIAHCSGDEE
jgi:hypothetical protein